MHKALRDVLVSRGWRHEWLDAGQSIAGVELRPGGAAFVPYRRTYRSCDPSRNLTIYKFFLESDIHMTFSTALRYNWKFLGMIEGSRSRSTSAARICSEFPWGQPLVARFKWATLEPYRHDLYDFPRSWQPDYCEHLVVIDESKRKQWRMEIRALRWVAHETIEWADPTALGQLH